MNQTTISLFRSLKSGRTGDGWIWLRLSETDFADVLKLLSAMCQDLKKVSSDSRFSADIYTDHRFSVMLIAEPEFLSPSPFQQNTTCLTVGFTDDADSINNAVKLLDPGMQAEGEPMEPSGESDDRIIRKLFHYLYQAAENRLRNLCIQAALPGPRLEKEGAEFFEILSQRFQTLFGADYVEIQPQSPSVFWSDRPDGWSWIQTSSRDFQWPVSLSSEREWELYRIGDNQIIEDVASEKGITLAEQPGGMKLQTGLLMPLVYGGRRLGLLKFIYARPTLWLNYEETALSLLQDNLALLFDRCRENLRTQRMAMIDGLTDLYNHRFFLTQLRTEYRRSLRYHSPMTLIMIDIDDFKKYNDSYGHQVGNRVLAWVAQKIRGSVRDIDFVARYGGEEFALILPEIKAEDGLIVAEKIRKAVSSEIVMGDSGERLRPITISCGVTDNSRAKRSEDLIEQADQALYWVKRHGRNLVRLADADS